MLGKIRLGRAVPDTIVVSHQRSLSIVPLPVPDQEGIQMEMDMVDRGSLVPRSHNGVFKVEARAFRPSP